MLAALKLATFRETFLGSGFAIPYPADDLAAFEAASYAPQVVALDLADPARATWLAELEGRPVGYASVGPCNLPHADARPDAGQLYQLYLAKAAQGHGLGGRLLDLTLAYLEERWPGPVWLGVWSGNFRAQRIYAGRGFRKVGDYGFQVGAWQDEEYIFRRG